MTNTQTSKPAAGASLPVFDINMVNGDSQTIGQANGSWQLIIVYRGKHCGRCKKYLNILESMKSEWEAAGFSITVFSADTLEKVQADIKEFGWTFPIGYGFSETDMKNLGVYVSDPLTPDETDRRFAEPAVFCLRPDATVQIAAISNGPSARPDLAELLDGMIFTIEHGKPARGTVAL
jgi:peroxiredoxin